MATRSGAKSGKLAERYAKALFELASEKGLLDAVAADLRTVSNMTRESGDLALAMESPLVDRASLQRAMDSLSRRAGLTDLSRRFLGVLANNRRLAAFAEIATSYNDLLATSRGEHTAEVTSAAPLRPAQQESLKAKLAGQLGGTIHLDCKIDPAILGGLVVKIGSRMIDSSLRGKLERIGFMMKGTA